MIFFSNRMLVGRLHFIYKVVIICITITALFYALTILNITKSNGHVGNRVLTYLHENQSAYEKFCSEMNRRIANEHFSNDTIQLYINESIPYWYSRWQSTSIMPRLLTPCEHGMYMHMLSLLIERVFSKYNIAYMMKAATLLGNYITYI